MSRSVIVDTTMRLVFHSALVFSLYLLFAGHNQPGGGFVGGLTAAAAFGLVYVAGGIDDVRSLSRLRPWTVLGGGLTLAAAAAVAPLFVADDALESGYILKETAPVLGTVKFSSTLIFDTGVYGVVVGLVLMIIEGVGQERAAPARSPAPDPREESR